MANEQPTLGETIRERRLDRDRTLRELACALKITPSYLSDIENDRRVPAEDVLQRIADSLDLPLDDLMALAGRLGDAVNRYLRRTPAAGQLFRRISWANLQGEALERLIKEAEELGKSDQE